jgi:hypothetical protein
MKITPQNVIKINLILFLSVCIIFSTKECSSPVVMSPTKRVTRSTADVTHSTQVTTGRVDPF